MSFVYFAVIKKDGTGEEERLKVSGFTFTNELYKAKELTFNASGAMGFFHTAVREGGPYLPTAPLHTIHLVYYNKKTGYNCPIFYGTLVEIKTRKRRRIHHDADKGISYKQMPDEGIYEYKAIGYEWLLRSEFMGTVPANRVEAINKLLEYAEFPQRVVGIDLGSYEKDLNFDKTAVILCIQKLLYTEKKFMVFGPESNMVIRDGYKQFYPPFTTPHSEESVPVPESLNGYHLTVRLGEKFNWDTMSGITPTEFTAQSSIEDVYNEIKFYCSSKPDGANSSSSPESWEAQKGLEYVGTYDNEDPVYTSLNKTIKILDTKSTDIPSAIQENNVEIADAFYAKQERNLTLPYIPGIDPTGGTISMYDDEGDYILEHWFIKSLTINENNLAVYVIQRTPPTPPKEWEYKDPFEKKEGTDGSGTTPGDAAELFKSLAPTRYSSSCDCWCMSNKLQSGLCNLGYNARTWQYPTSLASNHRTVDYKAKGSSTWTVVPYRAYGFDSKYNDTKSMYTGTIISQC
jgi:hypothetical protein